MQNILSIIGTVILLMDLWGIYLFIGKYIFIIIFVVLFILRFSKIQLKKLPWILIFTVLLMIVIPLHISYEMEMTKKEMLKTRFICIEGNVVIERFYKLGYSRYCILENGQKHGKWEVWEHQRLEIEGNYFRGKRHGKWIWRGGESTNYKVVEYRNGIEMSRTTKPSR